jgi:hypothetical protein
MKNRSHHRPQVESLESKALLSGSSAAVSGALAAVVTSAAPAKAIHLTGTVKGSYHLQVKNPDTGKNFTFVGSGKVAPLGQATLTGSIQSPGNIANGHSTGLLVLSTPRGSLTLDPTGPPQNGNTPVPNVFSFKITRATGTFKGDTGTGYIDLVLKPAPTPTVGSPSLLGGQGTFTMIFLTIPPP